MSQSALINELLLLNIPAKHLLEVVRVVASHQGEAPSENLSKAAIRKRRERDRKRDMSRDVALESVTATEQVTSPSPSLSLPPAPPLSPSPSPPSPHAPTPTHPHPPTPVCEEGAGLLLEVEEQAKPDRFDEFWKLYPRKVAKDKAREKWAAVAPELVDTILAAVVAHTNSIDWQKNDGQYIPHAATWLHNKRWEDELKAAIRSDVQAVHTSNDELGFLNNDDAIFHKA